MAGIDHVKGNAVVIIDADLQDPPELIPEMYAKMKDGFQVVYARRRKSRREPLKEVYGKDVLPDIGGHYLHRYSCRHW